MPVGIDTATGRLEVPDFHLAGWYRDGGRPGASGPTVVVGHVDSRRGPAVFFGLRELVIGDVVEIVDVRGDIARYSVTGSAQYPKAAFPTFDVFGATDGDILRLITCNGEFDRERRSYLDNLVVTAERVDDPTPVAPGGDLSG